MAGDGPGLDMTAFPIWPPVAGTYAMKMARGGVRVPVRIWFGPAIIDGEEQDRGHDWRCEIDGRTDRWEKDDEGYSCRVPIEVDRAWPYCAREPIDDAEYRFLIADAQHAREHRPDHPKAQPREKIDFNKLQLPF